MKTLSKNTFLRSWALPVSILTASFVFSPISASAEVVEVEGQSDCSHLGTDWRSAGLVVVVGAGRTYTICAKMEQVEVVPEPSSTSTADRSEPETVSMVAGADPYPNIPTGGEIPGTLIESTDETSWPQFASNTFSAQWRCPLILGPNGDPYAAENNGFDSVSGKWFRVCVKNPWREPIPQSVSRNYEAEKSAAIAEALSNSQAWNAANPGKQKCFQWGPLTSPSGGTESGGVCANPIGSASESSETLTRTEQVSRLASISNMKKRTSAALELFRSLDSEERADLLEVTQTSNRRAVLEIDLAVPKIPFIVRATGDSLPTITFRGTTNANGESTIRTRKNLDGYALTLSVRKVKLDLDVFG
jgi:hypothetical protein